MSEKRNLPLSLNCLPLLVLIVLGTPALAEEGVHFNSIFTEGSSYSVDEAKEQINVLTDKSEQQKNLETTLNPELKKENERLRNMSDNKGNEKESIGVVRNKEIKQKVVYFLELRPLKNSRTQQVYYSSNTLSPAQTRLLPGDLVKVEDTVDGFVHKKRMDRDNQGLWRRIDRKGLYNSTDLHTYYDWKVFETIIPSEAPVELDILVPRNASSIPVYSRPGGWTPYDCGLDAGLCSDRIDQHAEAYLFDTTFVKVNDLRTRKNRHQLFYKIGYRLYDREGQLRHKIGWVPSYHARRKISQLPKRMLASASKGFIGYESDEERLARLRKYYVFNENMNSDNKLTNRWINKQPGRDSEVFDRTIQFDGVAGFQYFSLDQSFNEETFNQYGALVGVGIYAPIYVDLEVQGNFLLNVPISLEETNNDIFEKSMIFRADQWLMYTTPLGINKLPLKIGIGSYYLSMFKDSDAQFGFKSFIGFQMKAMVESEQFWFDIRYGPTGQDFNFDFSNNEVGMSLGYRLDPEDFYDSWTLYGDYGSTTFTSETSGHTTEYDLIQLGVRKTF